MTTGMQVRYRKRGTLYTIVGEAGLQMSNGPLTDGQTMVVYRGEDGRLWVRAHDEFHDGRFSAEDDAVNCKSAAGCYAEEEAKEGTAMNDRYFMSGPEEGDTIDQTVLVCDEDGTELIEIRAGTLSERKSLGRSIAKLMNEAEAKVL